MKVRISLSLENKSKVGYRSQKKKELNSAAHSIEYNLENILNFFENRSTNANRESFNSKIKLFRANMMGFTDVSFLLFILKNLFT